MKTNTREDRGLTIAATNRLRRKGDLWIVPSQSGNGSYVVDPQDGTCSCPDYETRGTRCKHVFAVVYTTQRETAPDGTTTVTETVTTVKRATYKQDWHAYNLAQTTERTRVAELLHGLCAGIVQPEQKGRGQRRHLLSDAVFAAAMKVYGGVSGRRSMSDLNDYVTEGYLTKAPHYNSLFVYFEDAALTPLLKALIEESASPLRAVETDFAVDASGFSTSTFGRWFEEKYGQVVEGKPRRKFVKCHLMVGVKTHVVTSVEVTDGHENDSPYLPQLVQTTAQRFKPAEISADKGYLAHANLAAIEAVGAAPYIPFKSNSQGQEGPELWRRMFHYFQFEREAFLQHYHKRSNVETVFSMVKAKFGASVRSKSDVAQKNEVLLKVLCHNLCVLVQAIYELGIEPVFWPAGALKREVVAS